MRLFKLIKQQLFRAAFVQNRIKKDVKISCRRWYIRIFIICQTSESCFQSYRQHYRFVFLSSSWQVNWTFRVKSLEWPLKLYLSENGNSSCIIFWIYCTVKNNVQQQQQQKINKWNSRTFKFIFLSWVHWVWGFLVQSMAFLFTIWQKFLSWSLIKVKLFQIVFTHSSKIFKCYVLNYNNYRCEFLSL